MPEQISDQARDLDRSIGDLTASLGDPTRRAIFIAVRESPEPATTASIAALFEIHPNVARHHLDRLANDGYLRVTHRRPSGRSGPGAGRPAKCYEATGKGVELHFPSRRYDLLIDLLLRVLNQIENTDLGSVAQGVGHEYRKELAEEIGSPGDAGYAEALRAVATAMTGLGFDMAPDTSGTRLLTSHCPFGSAASGHPEVVCSLDRGIVSGLFEAISRPCDPVLHPDHGDNACVTEVPVTIMSR